MIKIIDIMEMESWHLAVSSMPHDFYHTNAYHRLEDTGRPKLIDYSCGDLRILLPCIIREIDGGPFSDVTSVYGYSGPLCNKRTPSQESVLNFHKTLNGLFVEERIVSFFARLHPLLQRQQVIAASYGEIIELNKVVYIDLDQTLEEQRRKYKKSLKHRINQLGRSGFTIRKAATEKDLDNFVRLYHETMDRVNADASYYFSRDYFERFLKAEDFESFILLAEYEGNIAAGSLFTVCGNIMQYHLSGTYNRYLKFASMKLILDEARKLANQMNLSWFNLGGGVGGINDSLFKFKAEFSDTFKMFNIWKKIINQEKYNELVKKRFGDKQPVTNFFPLYRM